MIPLLEVNPLTSFGVVLSTRIRTVAPCTSTKEYGTAFLSTAAVLLGCAELSDCLVLDKKGVFIYAKTVGENRAI